MVRFKFYEKLDSWMDSRTKFIGSICIFFFFGHHDDPKILQWFGGISGGLQFLENEKLISIPQYTYRGLSQVLQEWIHWWRRCHLPELVCHPKSSSLIYDPLRVEVKTVKIAESLSQWELYHLVLMFLHISEVVKAKSLSVLFFFIKSCTIFISTRFLNMIAHVLKEVFLNFERGLFFFTQMLLEITVFKALKLETMMYAYLQLCKCNKMILCATVHKNW